MFKIIKKLQFKEWLLVMVSAVLIVWQVYVELKIPDYMKEITTIIQNPTAGVSAIFAEGGFMLMYAFMSLILAVIVGYISCKVAMTLGYRLRNSMFTKVESMSMEEINRFSTASLITRSTNDIVQVQMLLVFAIQILLKAPVMAVWALIKMSGTSGAWSWLVVGGVAIIVVLVAVVIIIALPRFKKMQKYTDDVNKVARENLTGIRVVRAYNAEKFEEKRFGDINDTLTSNYLGATRTMALLHPTMTFVMTGISLGIYWIGAYLINDAVGMDKKVLFTDMMAYSAYAMQVIMSFLMLIMVFIMLPRVMVSAKRINEVLDTENTIVDGTTFDNSPDDNNGKKAVTGELEFINVSFEYNDGGEDKILSNVSFKANKGDMVAIIGATGSGKSTLVNLIPRLYDATSGAVLVNGVDVKEYSQFELRNKIAYVPQKAVLFSGTVNSNVAYGDSGKGTDVNENMVKTAVEIAQGKNFVEKMDDSYASKISQGGTNVSGGQKQRLSIARAVYRKPEIFVFDDSFSALDYATDRKLRTALKNETEGSTTIVVSQRIGTIKDANLILVLEGGEVVGSATHDELMKTCEVYREIAYSQLSEEELKNV